MTERKQETARKLCLIFQAATLRITKAKAIERWASKQGEKLSIFLIYRALKTLR